MHFLKNDFEFSHCENDNTLEGRSSRSTSENEREPLNGKSIRLLSVGWLLFSIRCGSLVDGVRLFFSEMDPRES